MLEMVITMAMMGIVTAAAIGTLTAMQRQARNIGDSALLGEALRSGLLYVVDESRDVGGVGIPAWSSVIIEDDCSGRAGYPGCQGSDRLTLVQGIPSYPGCRVKDDLGGNRVRFESVDDGRRRDPRCCFRETGFTRQVALIKGDTVRPMVAIAAGDDCVFSLQPIVPDSALPRRPSDGFNNSVAVLADVKTFYVEWAPDGRLGDLKLHMELDGVAGVDGERLTVLSNVADFQVAIGYDIRDLSPLESATGSGDAWWPNSPTETGASPHPADRAAFLGVSTIVVGRGSQPKVMRTPWGPERTLGPATARMGVDRVRLGSN
jgi:type II secretory pathway pseudopilin PulG